MPASYLEAFSETTGRRKPAVWRYSRARSEPDLIGVRDAAVWKDIYAFDDDEGKRSAAIEDLLAEVEGAFCVARRKLDRSGELNVDERVAVARFMAFQMLRTPRSLQLGRDQMAQTMKEEVLALASDPDRFREVMGAELGSREECQSARVGLLSDGFHFEADHFTGLHAMMNVAAPLWLWLILMDWTVYVSDGTYQFLTSDNPVAAWAERVVDGEVGTEVGVALVDSNLRLSFPITPLLSLVGIHSRCSLTAMQADKVEQVQSHLRSWRPQLRYTETPPNRIKCLNHATVVNADRYVFCGERDSRVERFLSRFFINQPSPVRRWDRKPIGSPT